MRQNQCDHDNFIPLPRVNLYLNDQLTNIQNIFSKQNVDFRLYKMLHGTIHMFALTLVDAL